MGEPVLSRSGSFHFETVRTLGSAPFDGADYGEVVSAVSRIKPGDFESWYAQWVRMARRVHARAERLSDRVSRGKALLRASSYLRTAEFYLGPDDPRRSDSARSYRAWFDAGLRAIGVDATRSRLPYDGVEMETIFLRSPRSDGRDVIVVHGGFDSTPEELYFTVGAGALERGYHVLIFEGPGQGNLIREFGLPFTPDWHRPAGVAIDSLTEHIEPARIIGVGLSFGGDLLARAAAREPRYDGIVLFDYFPPMLDAFRHRVPRPLRGYVATMPAWLRRLIRLYARVDTDLRWALQNAQWTFGVSNLPDLVAEMRRYDDRSWAGDIRAHVLLMLGEQERFFDTRSGHDFARRLTTAASVTVREFSAADGGGLHCRVGAVQIAHEAIFDWVGDAVVGRSDRPSATASSGESVGTQVR